MRTACLVFLLLAGCSRLYGKLPKQSPPLFDMEEPLALHQPVEDEEERRDLAAGGFTGVYVSSARGSIEEMDSEPEGLLVTRVVENSPGAAAGLLEGDLLLRVTQGGTSTELRWPSEWRAVELSAGPGARLAVVYDRAGADRDASLVVVPRVHPAPRGKTERFREEERVGVVLRTATEVEARAAGLGPGGGAVLVGMARTSPWRTAGLRFGDLIVSVDGQEIAHPQVLLDAVRAAPQKGSLELIFRRDGAERTVNAAVSRRKQETKLVRIPVLLTVERNAGFRKTSVLLGLYRYKATPAAWESRLLWIFTWRGGDADRLEEVKEPAK